MSTNYYWRYSGEPEIRLLTGRVVTMDVDADDPNIHIGKFVNSGPTGQFNWAQEPDEVKAVLREHLDVAVVVDEYGAFLTGSKLLGIMDGTRTVLSVGVRFS